MTCVTVMSVMATTYFRVTEAANQIGLSRQRVWLYIRDGRLKATENEFGLWLISQKEIDRFKATLKPSGRPKSNNRKNGKKR